MARFPLAIKIANLLVYVFLTGANLYSGLGPDKDRSPYGQDHLTYISPASFTFGVWGLIHFLLGGFVIYQFFSSNEQIITDGINWHFVGITLLNTLWLALWQTDHLILAWFTILITASQVSYVYAIINREDSSGANISINERIWVHAPFSLYHAWIVVIAVISTFAAFAPDKTTDDDGNPSKPGLLLKIFVVIGLLFLESTAVGYLEKFKGDIGGAIVIAWSLLGVFIEQDDPIIHWTSLVFSVITLFHIFKALYVKFFRRSGSESAPLLA